MLLDPQAVPRLTEKGDRARKRPPEASMPVRARNIMVLVDGRKSVEDIREALRGLEGVEEAFRWLLEEGYVTLAGGTGQSVAESLIQALLGRLGEQAAPLCRKVREILKREGTLGPEHLEELDHLARTMYGFKVATELKPLMEDHLRRGGGG